MHTVGLGLSTLEQSWLSIAAEVGGSIDIGCKITSTSFEKDVIHWYWQKPNQALEHLIYVTSTKGPVRSHADEKRNKVEARKNSQLLGSTLRIYFIGKEDTSTYYCAGWNTQSLRGRLTVLELWRQLTQDPCLGFVPTTTSFPILATATSIRLPSWASGLSLTLSATLPQLPRKPLWLMLAHQLPGDSMNCAPKASFDTMSQPSKVLPGD